MAKPFDVGGFIGRWVFAVLLVFGTYNPTQYSYVGWVMGSEPKITPVIAIVGLLLLIGWIIYLRATFLSMGWLGIVLGAALFGCVVWLLVDVGWLSLQVDGAMSWIVLGIISLLLAIGISWSIIRRRLTGQVDTDDVEDGRG